MHFMCQTLVLRKRGNDVGLRRREEGFAKFDLEIDGMFYSRTIMSVNIVVDFEGAIVSL